MSRYCVCITTHKSFRPGVVNIQWWWESNTSQRDDYTETDYVRSRVRVRYKADSEVVWQHRHVDDISFISISSGVCSSNLIQLKKKWAPVSLPRCLLSVPQRKGGKNSENRTRFFWSRGQQCTISLKIFRGLLFKRAQFRTWMLIISKVSMNGLEEDLARFALSTTCNPKRVYTRYHRLPRSLSA